MISLKKMAKCENVMTEILERICFALDVTLDEINKEVVKAKKAAAEEMAIASGVRYMMYAGSLLMKTNVLDCPENLEDGQQTFETDHWESV